MRVARISTALCLGLCLAGTSVAVPEGAAAAAVPACSRGLVALTFDDGPDALTTRVQDVLRDRRAPATFFVVGEKVRTRPTAVRRASALGFTIGNHTYGHERLPRLSDAAIRSTLLRTRQAIVAAGARPSWLVRPSYGATNARVRNVIAGMGLVQVLWTVDPRDWDGRSASRIVSSTLGQLKPGQRNIVLLHDGVRNSRRTLVALPGIISGARARGYCFAGLGVAGAPTPVLPGVRIHDGSVGERPGGSVARMTVSLDQPTARATSVRVRTVDGTARAGRDYVAVDTRVRFPVGVTRQVVRVRVRDDLRDERAERFRLRLSGATGATIKDAIGVVTIRDDDPAPRLTVRDSSATEPAAGSLTVPVALRLGRASERWVRVTVSAQPGTADAADYVPVTKRVTFAPGQVAARVDVVVLADPVAEGPETFVLRATAGTNVTFADPTGVVTILPAG
jgi:peptidoglycan-N-acetylglucosamine deacetylase